MALYIGTNYQPHDWDIDRYGIDIKLMKEAGFTTVRLGHLCWDSYEPEEGVYTFEWFDKVMDLFHEAGINVVLDISMRPAPIWVHKLCPGCNIYGKSGNHQPSIRRYLEDVDDPAYQTYALRFARMLINRYKEHPALFSFGLCNELGAGPMSYSEYAKKRFQNWLKKKYKTVDELNKAWATQRWCRKLTSFEDVVLQENEVAIGAPEAWLDMRRFYSDGIGNFVIRLKNVVSELAPGIPHSSNHYSGMHHLGFDYLKVADQFVDYPGMGFYPGQNLDDNFQYCNIVQKERLAELGKPMWFLEFQSGCHAIFALPNGFMRMHMMLSLMNRTQMILGWTWRTMLNGEEQFYHGLIGHDGIPTPNYYEYQRTAKDLRMLQKYGFPYLPAPEIGVAYNQESEWVTQYQKGQFKQRYQDNIIHVHRVFYESNQEYNMVDLRNLKNEYRLIIIPEHVLIEAAVAETIRRFVEKGGTVIMTGYSGNVDETGKAFSSSKPGYLSDVFGIRVAGFCRTNIKGFHSKGAEIIGAGNQSHELLKVDRDEARLLIDVDYYEELELKTAECFARFTDKNTCAISVNQYGKGEAYYMATESNQTLLAWLVAYVTKDLGIEKGVETPTGVQARRISCNQYFYVNTNDKEVIIPLVRPGKGILSDSYYQAELLLNAYDSELIVSM